MSVVTLLVLGQAVLDHIDHLAPATLIIDGVPRRVRTRCATVGELLSDMGVMIAEQDAVDPGLDAPVQSGMTISVRYARPVAVAVDGALKTLYTRSGSAAEVLREAGVALRPGDRLLVNGEPASDQQAAFASFLQVQRAAAITFVDGEQGAESTQKLYTLARTLDRALAEAQVLLYLGDQVDPSLDTPVYPGMTVRIRRAMPVRVYVDGRTLRTRTQSETVGGVLAELGVSLLGKDFSVPAPSAAVRHGMQIQVVRVTERTIVEQDEVPYETVWVADPELELDHRRLDDAGANGVTRRRYKAVYHDGRQMDRYLEAEWTAQEPRTRQIAYGTQIVVRTRDTPHGPIEYWRRIRVFRTAYTEATCGKELGDPWYGLTRLGWQMRHGIIAVDPRVIRLRSNLYVPDYGPGIAGDTGGGINGRHIDLGYEVGDMVWHFEWGYVYVLTPVPRAGDISWILPDYPRER